MEWMTKIDLVQAANALVILIVGLAAGLGWRSGKKSPPQTPEDATVAVAGALVDGSSVRILAEVIEHYRVDQERARKIGHELVEEIERLRTELGEIRREMQMRRR
ncbi:hypothetical protein [Aliihoeflea sp. 2WW]|uniref:hypothetical protein n=1 Tax=Aliihoeflea sp. 2WW TaxID=1381123 RepID=UPI000466DB9F|nr:hypothetical protein [Aliihoeflea sp. 2WW]